jgi:hypothetical protein
MRVLAAIAATLAFGPAAFAGADVRCDVPAALIEPQALLPHVAASVKRTQKLDVVVLSGTPSQMGGGDAPRSYPSFLEAELRARLPKIEIRVTVRTAPRRTAMEVVPTLPQILTEEKPTLVVWQSGTVESYRGIDADGYGRKLERGVGVVLENGADVLLVNMQFSPRTDAMVDAAAYTEAMRAVSFAKNVPFFNRYRIMREWSESGTFDLTALHIGRKEYEEIHRCIGSLMADFVIRAATLAANASR